MQVGLIELRKCRQGISAALTGMAALVLTLAFFSPGAMAQAQGQEQGWFQTGTGLGVTKARVAVPEFAPSNSQAHPLEKTFHDVLWADLDYSGVLELVSPSFYPTQVPTQPSELKAEDWSAAPVNAFTLWEPGALEVTAGESSIATFNKTPRSARKWRIIVGRRLTSPQSTNENGRHLSGSSCHWRRMASTSTCCSASPRSENSLRVF